jgi:hypothetical protein
MQAKMFLLLRGSSSDDVPVRRHSGSMIPHVSTGRRCQRGRWPARELRPFRSLVLALLLIIAGFAEAFAAEGQSVAVPFTPLHIYYISPTGNDHRAGTSVDGAWATPHHNVNCGDVIIALAGSYTKSFGINNWGAVSNCPSTSGGIDGAAGIYFAIVLCAGPYITSCPISAGEGEAARIDASN